VEEVLCRFPQWRPQLAVLFDCLRLLGLRRTAPQFPTAGEVLGDFLLLAELGGGAQGRVFLASQLSLGDRPVVLKVTPGEAIEHLSLARLQHTHIVPLYSVQDCPGRGLRALCMPYFGGATLAQLLEAMRPQPPAQRSGQNLLDTLDLVQAVAPVVAPATGPARQALAQASYAQAVCWIGYCLADALQYAHARGLVHLDLKPSNVLLAADGTPMLLDFHLAREPIDPDREGLQWLGGTAGYMSPEQQAALRALEQGRPAPRPVDGRSDIYSLGVVLYEARREDCRGVVANRGRCTAATRR
jgi:serine/threonine protein kinase